MSEILTLLGIQNWKPVLTALVMPPVPLLLATLIGARLMLSRRGWGWTIILISLTAMWLSTCMGFGRIVEATLLHIPPVVSSERLTELRNSEHTAIVILGGGREDHAPEYRSATLSEASLERLRYGIWLARATNLPLAFTGGIGWGNVDGPSEAEIAARIAEQEFGFKLRWTETASRDTRENASKTLPLLQAAGVRHAVIVTHGWHMPRSVRAFDKAGTDLGVTIEPAPISLGKTVQSASLEWIPTSEGFFRVRRVLREALGKTLGF